jgi:hypothetical protein
MRLIISIIGLFAGMGLGFSALLFNPLEQSPVALTKTEVYDLSPLEFHGVALDDVMLLNIPLEGSGTPFAAENMTHSNASIVVLRGANGEAVALGTRLVMAGDDSDLLGANLAVQTYTNIFWPNRGSLMMHGLENRWSVLRSHVLEGDGSATSWPVSIAPDAVAKTGILGGSGALESIGGSYSEELQLNPAGDGTFVGRISLEKSIR